MKIRLWSIGKEHDATVKAGVDVFTQRLSKYYPAEWLIIPPPKNAGALPPAALKKSEADIVLSLLKPDDYLVLLDEKGKSFTSEELARLVQARLNERAKNLVFLIGGAYGTDETVRRNAKTMWSLSSLTFPHQLVRLILAEQLYRACTILRNEKYHHS